MWDALPVDMELVVNHFYNLRTEISRGIYPFSKEELIAAKELVENEFGKGVIEERDAELLLSADGTPSDIIVIYVIFEEDDKRHNEKYGSKIFFIQNGKIIAENNQRRKRDDKKNKNFRHKLFY